MNRNFIFFSFGLLLLFFIGCTGKKNQPEKTERPNIVIIFTDDQGYGDLGCYGHPTIKTPNIDKMADEGMRFTQFYVASSICTPSRGALLTGRLPVRTGVHTGVFFPDSEGGIPSEEITLGEAMKEAGYATACFGKWHLGHHEQYLPTNNGFDEYFGIPYSNDMGGDPDSEWPRKRNFPPLPLVEGTNVIEDDPDQRYITKRYTEKAVDYIKSNKDTTFLLYLPHTMPHTPLFASEQFRGESLRGLYGDVIHEIDWSVGEVLSALKDAGIEEKTLVFFLSDNGPWLSEKQDGGSAGLLREGKFTTFEGGMRVPAVAWWPQTIESGRVETAIASSMDIFPTCLSLAKAELPTDRDYDGYDMTKFLKGETGKIRDAIFYYRSDQLYAVRKGKWKMHLQTIEKPYQGENKVYEDRRDNPLLFNVAEDPSEKYNVAEQNPEIIEEIKTLVQEHRENLTIAPSVINPPNE